MCQARSIQDAVATALAEMGFATASLVHTVLLRNCCFVGHKYRFDGGSATWLAEKNAIDIYDGEGKLLKTVPADIIQRQQTAA
jgi:hypothetical protein